MQEAKDKRLELIRELRSTHALQESGLAVKSNEAATIGTSGAQMPCPLPPLAPLPNAPPPLPTRVARRLLIFVHCPEVKSSAESQARVCDVCV